MVLGKLIAAAFGIATVAIVGIFIRDAAAQGLGPAIGATGAGLGTLGSGIGQVGTGIGTGISGVFKPFTDLLGFFGTLGQFFGGAPAAGGAPTASVPAGQAAARTNRPSRIDRSNLSNLATRTQAPLSSTVIGNFVRTASGAMKAPLLGGGFRVSTTSKTDLSRLSATARSRILGARGL